MNDRSLNNLKGVHPDLVRVIVRADEIGPLEFIVTEGIRTVERQKQLFRDKKSKTMKSRHLTGHAVDLAVVENGKVTWDWSKYEELNQQVHDAAKLEGVVIEWGGNWTSFRDGVHFQLPHGVV